jgi:predicted branched-subunit amino acid permease
VIVVVPFSLLFGVAATDAGLTLGQAMGFTVLVIAGASQFAALQMMVDQAGIAFVLLAALAVNLRMAMYSAALVPHIGAAPLWQRACVAYLLFDQTYLASVKAYEEEPDLTLRQKVAFFFGVATPITPVWCAMTAVGVLVGATIPEAAALDFALPITFLAMVAPMLRTSAHLAAAATSVVVALALSGLPSGFGLLIAAACAMAVGVLVEDRV